MILNSYLNDLKKGECMLTIRKIIEDFGVYFKNLEIDKDKAKCTSIYNTSEKTPSMVLNLKTDLYYCFSRGTGGNAYTLLKEILKDPHHLSIYLESDNQERNEYDQKSIYNDSEIFAIFIFDLVVEYASYNLEVDANYKKYLNYLTQDRNFTTDIISMFKLGVIENSEGLINYLKAKIGANFKMDTLDSIGILRDGDFFAVDRILIPNLDKFGNTVNIEARTITETSPKYLRLANDIGDEYNNLIDARALHRGPASDSSVQESNQVILVEGPFDVIRLYENGIFNVFSLLGKTITDRQTKLLLKVSKRNIRIVLMLDSDITVDNGLLSVCSKIFDKKIVNLRKFHYETEIDTDPDEYLKTRDLSSWNSILNSSIDLSEIYIQSILTEFLNDNTMTTTYFLEKIGFLLINNTNMIEVITSSVEDKRGADISELKEMLRNFNLDNEITSLYLSKELGLETSYVDYLLSQRDMLVKRARILKKIENIMYDYLLEKFVGKKIDNNKLIHSDNILRSSFSSNHDVISRFGSTSLKVKVDSILYFKFKFDYMCGTITAKSRYRKFTHTRKKIDELSDHVALFVLHNERSLERFESKGHVLIEEENKTISNIISNIKKCVDEYLEDDFEEEELNEV